MISDMRVGYGWDIHKFAKGRRLVLCGVEIDSESGLLGHSDADAPVHALIDALLGALALRDIGTHFPDSDPRYKNADSMELLRRTLAMPEFKLWKISNIDITIITQKPKLAPYIPSMRNALSKETGVQEERISVKAKTSEGVNAAGRMEALESHAAVLLVK